ncbi:MAG: CPBP family intramembrane metalloprotease [Acidobacteria bacterium]|nr:CPBP family intramembrane metalloprotease [Acidobacteriota bacterium]
MASAPDPFAEKLRGFGAAGVLSMLVVLAGQIVPPLGALLALAWTHRSRTPWRDVGYLRPKSWWLTIARGVAFGAALKIALKAIVMPLLGAPAVNPAYHFLEGNTAALPGMVLTMIFVAGFGEETLFRGFLFERLGKLMGRGAGARIAIVILTSAFFASLHFKEQGIAGVEQAIITGLVFGTMYSVTGCLWPVIVAHAAFDLTAVAVIYLGLEPAVAHLVFG